MASATREIKTIFAIDGQQKYQDAIKKINDQQKTLNVELKASAAKYDLAGDKQGALRSKIDGLNKQIDLQRQKVAEARAAMEKATEKYGQNSETTQALTRDYHAAETSLAKLQKQLISSNKDLALQESRLKAAGEAAQKAGDKIKKVSDGVGQVGGKLTSTVTVPLMGIAAAAVAVGNAYEAQMDRVAAISGATTDEMKALDEQALKLGADTAFSAKEVGLGMENLASAGFTASETMAAIPGLLDLAAASGTDLGVASNFAASTLRQFKLDAKEAGHVADVFAEVAARTNAGTEDLGNTMRYVGPVAAAMGISFEEAAAAAGIMADAGIKGDQSGTALRGALSRLSKPTEAMAQTMTELGLIFFDNNGKMLSLTKMMAMLQNRTKGLTDEQKANALVTLFGQESLSGMLTLIEAGPDKISSLTKSLENSDGAAKRMAETMQGNTKGSIEQMMGSLETAGIKIQRGLAPTITELANLIGDLADKFSALTPEQQATIIKMAALAAGIGPVLVGVSKVGNAVGDLTKIWGKFAVKLAEKQAAEAAASALTGMAGSATAATGAAGGLIGVLGPLAVVIGAVALAMHIDYNSAAAKAARETKRLCDEVVQSATAFKATKEAIGSNASSAEKLASQLFALSGKEKLSNAEKAKMVAMVSQLNELYPDLNLQIDQQTGKLNQSEESVRAFIKAMKDQLLLKSEIERSLEIDRKEAELLKQKQDAESRRMVTAEALESKWGKLATGYAKFDRANTELEDINKNLDNLASERKEVNEAIDGIADSVVTGNKDMAKSGKDLAKDEKKSQKEIAGAAEQTSEEYAAALQARLEASEEYQKKLKDATSKHMEEMGSLDDNGIKKSKLTAAQIKRNLEKQIKDFREWQREIKNLSAKVPEDVMAELRALGPGAEPLIQELNNMTGDKLNAWIRTWREKSGLAASAAKEELATLPASMATIGANAGQGFVDGLNSKLAAVKASAKELGGRVTYGLKKTLDENSPSKVTQEIGEFAGDGLVIGLDKSGDAVDAAAGELASGVIDAMAGLDGTEASIRAQVEASGLPSQIGAASLASTSAMAAGRTAAAVAAAPAAGRLLIGGEITVRGVNDREQTMAVVRIIKNELQQELALSGRR